MTDLFFHVFRSLIACNVDVNFGIAPHGATPLYAASQRGQHDMVRLLLEHGANPNIKRTDDGGTVRERGGGEGEGEGQPGAWSLHP